MTDGIEIRSRFAVDDAVLTALHAAAFGGDPADTPAWAARLERHSVSWVGAFEQDRLVGFVHACWDGGQHAFLLDAVVEPARQRRGIGGALVHALVEDAARAGCRWVHVDFEPHLADFYRRCGFGGTAAGLVRL